MNQYFLPVGLLLSLIIALIIPDLGNSLKELGLIPWCVVIIFFINGYQTTLSEVPTNTNFIYALILTAFLCLILSPLLGLVTASILQLSAGLTLGLLVKSAVPSTLSTCIVMTKLAKGNGSWALVMTVILNILGVFTVPFMLSFTGGDNIEFTIDSLLLLQKLVVLVLIPFMLGFFAKYISFFLTSNSIINYIPSTLVIITVWLSLSASADTLYSITLIPLLKILAATTLVHFGLMFSAIISAKFLPIDNASQIAITLTASQKTLPVAISVLASFEHNVANAILFCVVFHFIQLFADAALLPSLKKYYKL